MVKITIKRLSSIEVKATLAMMENNFVVGQDGDSNSSGGGGGMMMMICFRSWEQLWYHYLPVYVQIAKYSQEFLFL